MEEKRTPSNRKTRQRAGVAFAAAGGEAGTSKQHDDDAQKSPVARYGGRRAVPSGPEPSGAELHKRQRAQLLEAQEQVARIMSAMGRKTGGGEVAPLKRQLAATQLQLAETERLLDSAREELLATKSRERDIVSSTRALGHRTHEQRDYIAAVETQLTTTRTKLQASESRIAEMMTFKRRSDQLTTQLGQERQRTRKKDEHIAELLQREVALKAQVATLILQRDAAPRAEGPPPADQATPGARDRHGAGPFCCRRYRPGRKHPVTRLGRRRPDDEHANVEPS